jgi:ABC-type uncharacterized transport system auxiliary subunit
MTAMGPGARRLCMLLLAQLTCGCALLTKAEPLTPRYFSAEPSDSRTVSADGRAIGRAAPARELKLGRVTSASYLGERLVFRDSAYELGFYEDRRWTEKPEAYFRRALSRARYEDGGFRRVVSGGGPTLDCELVELAELRAPAHLARARVNFVLYDPRSVRTEATVTVDLPIAASNGEAQATASVAALSQALVRAVDQIVSRVSSNLDAPMSAPAAVSAR